MRFIGITGGVGAGKSEILRYIQKNYLCEIYLADDVAHEVKKKGTACYEKLVALLGKDVLQEDGEIDKKKMAAKIFADKSLLEKVNALVHPAVKEYLLDHLMKARAAGKVDLFFVEAALLIEAGYGEFVDEMWYIFAQQSVRRKRLKEARGYSDEKIEQIMKAQLSEEEFRANCDFVVDNSGDLEKTYEQISRRLEAYTKQKYVFGLDIGTRSIVGTVGYLLDGKFHVVAQKMLEHDTRAMMDGQIHDIPKVGEGIVKVRTLLEEELGMKLEKVCVAAAGRVLRTVTEKVVIPFESERDVTEDDISALSMKGVQNAYEELYREVGTDSRFYCVGHTVMHYYVNDYSVTNPEGHKGSLLAADMIATFLPDEVVDGLYKAVEYAKLQVANLTLEPIAAIRVAIPEKYRLLNMALVDVGAGTSDICITKDGAITAYGMLPMAGDKLTDCIATHYLVDFDKAERIKREVGEKEQIPFEDIMGLQQSVSSSEVLELLDGTLTEMIEAVADKILELNGGKPVSAVFIVGGGGIIPGYANRLAKQLGIPKERVAVRGKEVMQDIVFENKDPLIDSMMVTPIGICYSFYEPCNNFIFVDINGVRTKIYDNGRLTISDAAMGAKISNEDLFPKRGKSISYTVGDRVELIKGKLGEPSYIRLNGSPAGLHDRIRNGDQIQIKRSTKGEDAILYVKQLPEMKDDLNVWVDGRKVVFPKRVEVNNVEKSKEYRIKDGDQIKITKWYPLDKIAAVLAIPPRSKIFVNQNEAKPNAKIYDGYEITWEVPPEYKKEPETLKISPEEIPESQGGTGFDRLANRSMKLRSLQQQIKEAVTQPDLAAWEADFAKIQTEGVKVGNEATGAFNVGIPNPEISNPSAINTGTTNMAVSDDPTAIVVEVNGQPVILKGKNKYVYVDVFNFYPFDLTPRAGYTIVTLLNGRQAEYMGPIKQGDKIELTWKPL